MSLAYCLTTKLILDEFRLYHGFGLDLGIFDNVSTVNQHSPLEVIPQSQSMVLDSKKLSPLYLWLLVENLDNFM